ncbi:MAG: GPR endopeptidase [Ruminococcaceae bacterium]|nr:GPR endopeptidase [Oscillospiraceae bacterium]
MKGTRTDLALEACEIWRESANRKQEITGVACEKSEKNGYLVHRVRVTDERGAQAIGKPVGNYITMELLKMQDDLERSVETLSGEISALLPKENGCTLIVGLGNHNITPDAVGYKTVGCVVVTRHLVSSFPKEFGFLHPTAALVPGVLGTTGCESFEILCGVVEKIKPSCVIVVDALAARSLERLCRTVQITDTGIVPGSGVGNARAAINRETLGVPTIAIGVPTVMDLQTISKNITESMMVTPQEIDTHVSEISKLIGFSINRALHPTLSMEDIELFLQ